MTIKKYSNIQVLTRILERANPSDQDLLNMRAVCRTWREGATKAYSKGLSMNLVGDADSVTKMFVFMDLIQDPLANLPFPTTLRIDSPYFCRQKKMVKIVQRFFEDFLRFVAPTLEEIEFSVNAASELDSEFNAFKAIIEFPKLKACTFYLNDNYFLDQSIEYLTQACAMTLEGSRALERVKICASLNKTYYNDDENGAAISLVQKLDEKLLRRIPPTVKELYLDKILLQTTAQIMSQLALPVLEILEIEATDSYKLGHADFSRIFSGCHGSLRDLKIRRYVGGVEVRNK